MAVGYHWYAVTTYFSKGEARRWQAVRVLAALALALVLVTSAVRIAANSLPLYEALFERHGVAERTGITADDLGDVGRQVQDYFRTDTEPLNVTAPVFGEARSLFTEDESAHMADVKQLFLRVYRAQGAAALFLIIVAVIAAVSLRRRAPVEIGRWLHWGAVLTAAALAVVGIASVVAFRTVFLLFHAIGFPQGNYLFDTRTSFLVRIFPDGFWEDMTLAVGAMALAFAALAWVVGYALARIGAAR